MKGRRGGGKDGGEGMRQWRMEGRKSQGTDDAWRNGREDGRKEGKKKGMNKERFKVRKREGRKDRKDGW